MAASLPLPLSANAAPMDELQNLLNPRSVPHFEAVASVSVSPATPSVNVGQTVQLTATAYDANNNVLTGRAVTWSSSKNG